MSWIHANKPIFLINMMIIMMLIIASLLPDVIVNGLLIHATNTSLIRFDGRGDYSIPNTIRFDHPGCSIAFHITNTSFVYIVLEAIVVIPNRFWVYINNELSSEVSIDTREMQNNTKTTFILASNLEKKHRYFIRLVKITEAQYNQLYPSPNYITFHGIEIEDDGHVIHVDPLLNSRKIEFVGDSITSGYCDLCHTIDSTYGLYTQQSYPIAYPSLVCDHYRASCHTAAWSGYGLVRNCCGGSTLMPEIYSRTLATVKEFAWNVSSWLPDVILINLGSNDNLNPDCYNSTSSSSMLTSCEIESQYVSTYIQFVQQIYTTAMEYNSNPKFFLACGPDTTSYCGYVQEVLQVLNQQGIASYYLDMGTMDFTDECCYHPSMQKHLEMANIAIKAITHIMGWEN